MHALTHDEILFLKGALKMYTNGNFKRLPNNAFLFNILSPCSKQRKGNNKPYFISLFPVIILIHLWQLS